MMSWQTRSGVTERATRHRPRCCPRGFSRTRSARAAAPTGRRPDARSTLELQCLRLGELLETERAEFAADAALLEPAERCRDVERTAVDVDLTGLHLSCERLCLVRVA